MKKAVFLSLVYNTHLSGGEAWGSLPGGTEAEMERFLVSRMRVLLSGEASTKFYNDEGVLIHCRIITNNEVRFRCGIPTCQSSLRVWQGFHVQKSFQKLYLYEERRTKR